MEAVANSCAAKDCCRASFASRIDSANSKQEVRKALPRLNIPKRAESAASFGVRQDPDLQARTESASV